MQGRLMFSLSCVACLLITAPAQAQWTTANLSAPRQGLQSAEAGGLTFFAGGRQGGAVSDVVDIYDPTTETWTAIHMPTVRTNFGMVALGNDIFFAGGAQSATLSTSRVDVLDASNLTWRIANLSVARNSLGAATVGGKVLFAGGSTGTLFAPVASSVVDIYDSSIGLPDNPAAWSVEVLSQARAALGSSAAGDFAIFAGGVQNNGVTSAVVDMYHGGTGTWHMASLSQARNLGSTASVSVLGRAYFAGGQVSQGVSTNRIDIFDSATGLWSQDSLAVSRFAIAATIQGNTAFFAGGLTSGGAPSSIVERFNSGTQTWASPLTMPVARAEFSAAAAGGKLLFAGGATSQGASAAVDIDSPVGINFCEAATNSTGMAAMIEASGTQSLTLNDLVLNTAGVPNTPFLYFHGPSQQQVPFGNGSLCTGGVLVRIMPPGMATGGVAQRAVDLPSASITTPGPRHFQCWYRDSAAGGGGFNTSDAATITFVP